MPIVQKIWSDEEVAALQSLYPYYQRNEVTKAELCDVFNRQFGSIRAKAEKLGLTTITPNTLNLDRLAAVQKRLHIEIDMTAFKQHMKGK